MNQETEPFNEHENNNDVYKKVSNEYDNKQYEELEIYNDEGSEHEQEEDNQEHQDQEEDDRSEEEYEGNQEEVEEEDEEEANENEQENEEEENIEQSQVQKFPNIENGGNWNLAIDPEDSFYSKKYIQNLIL